MSESTSSLDLQKNEKLLMSRPMPQLLNASPRTFASEWKYCAQLLSQNLLLGSLPRASLEELAPKLDLVQLERGQLLHLSNELQTFVYFPTSAIVSLQYTCRSGETTETSAVGNEGVVGLALFLGANSATTSAMVLSRGGAFRLHGLHVREEMKHGHALQQTILRYAPLLIAQMAQTSVCNRHHRVEQQVCRWLLSMLDRASSRTLQVTHEVIATALGVRREGVTEAAGNLQRLGVIRYRRGEVEVLNREGLEALACECYSVIRRAQLKLQSDPAPLRPHTR